MPRFRLNRRDVLRGMGSIAIGLPWLEAMGPVKSANAQSSAPAKRIVTIYQPGGAPLDKWHPSNGSETDFMLSPILAPFEAVKDKLLVLSGLNMDSADGEQHQAGIIALLTGYSQGRHHEFPSEMGPSLDQALIPIASQGLPRTSFEVAIRWATGKSAGRLHPINSLTFNTNGDPVPPRIDPAEIYDSLFGSLEPGDSGGVSTLIERKRSILDFLDRRYVALSQKVSATDRAKLDEHLTKIRELEQGLTGMTGGGEGCVQPEKVDTTGYDPQAGRNANLGNNGICPLNECISSDEKIPEVGKFMMDMLVMALTCDRTGVFTLQWSDTEAKHTFPWLNLSEHHHYYQHDGGFKPAECEQICTWYSEQHAYLLQQMAAVDMGGHSLLDESVVFIGSEISDPPVHSKNNMPLLLAGGGGGLRGGRWLQYEGRSHNDLLAGILNLFGDTRTTFGDARYATSAVTNLT